MNVTHLCIRLHITPLDHWRAVEACVCFFLCFCTLTWLTLNALCRAFDRTLSVLLPPPSHPPDHTLWACLVIDLHLIALKYDMEHLHLPPSVFSFWMGSDLHTFNYTLQILLREASLQNLGQIVFPLTFICKTAKLSAVSLLRFNSMCVRCVSLPRCLLCKTHSPVFQRGHNVKTSDSLLLPVTCLH